VVGLSVALATNGSSSNEEVLPFNPSVLPSFGQRLPSLGVVGTVANVGTDTFTVNAVSGQTVTVDEQSSTSYYNGATTASSSIVITGARVFVLGTRSGTTVTARRVVVLGSGVTSGLGGQPSAVS
jgi:hypothetical protein